VPEYANGKNCFVAGVNPKKAGEDFEGIPIFGVGQGSQGADRRHRQRDLRAAARRRRAIWEAVDADLDLVICITEGIPVRDMIEPQRCAQGRQAARRCCSAPTAPA
jgi:succinyl-CoA synthetase alpha subunit